MGGLERVYELGKDFRNEGVSNKHNPEFTMLETYEAYADYRDVMEMLEQLVAAVGARGDRRHDRALEGRRDRLRAALAARSTSATRCARRAASTCASTPTRPRCATRCAPQGLDAPDGLPWAKLVDGLLTQTLEPTLIQPTILHDYPVELSPFAKRRPDDPAIVERFEAFAGGMEIANAFTELNDPDDQRERFAAAAADREAGDDEAPPDRRGLPRRARVRHAAHRAAWAWASTAW